MKCFVVRGKLKAEPGPDRIVVFQNGALFPWKTNIENIAFGPIMQGSMTRQEAFEKARDMMADAGLRGIESNYPGEISSGVRRRVEIVRALMTDPKILLLDEPYRALDSLTKSVMHEALLEIFYKNRVTIFFITHDLEEAIFLGHRVVIMTTRPCRPRRFSTSISHIRETIAYSPPSAFANSWTRLPRPCTRKPPRRSPPARKSADHECR